MAKEAEIKRRTASFKQKFRNEFGACLEDIQFAFIDSKDDESSENQEQLRNIFDFIRNATPFSTADAKVVEGGLEFEAEAKKKEMEKKLKQEKEERDLAEKNRLEEQRKRQLAEEQCKTERKEKEKAERECRAERQKREEAERATRQQTERVSQLADALQNMRINHQPSPVVVVGGGGFPMGGMGGMECMGMDPSGFDMRPSRMSYGAPSHSSETVLANGGTFYRGVGRPRNSDYTDSGRLRRH